MRHILCIHLLNWPIDRLIRRLRWRKQQPPNLLLVHTVANRQIIVAADCASLQQGIRPGQTLTEARVRLADPLVRLWQPAEDSKALEALGRYLMRFTPVVATTTCDATNLFTEASSAAQKRPAASPLDPSVLYLDLTGCEHLFGGLDAMLRTIAQTLTRLCLFARLAVATNPTAAYALTCCAGSALPVAESDSPADILCCLPVASLRFEDRILHLLNQLGIETIAQLLKLPRNQLASRFGPSLLQRLDQALGVIPQPLVPLPCHRPIEGKMEFEGPVIQPEAIEEAFRRVLSPIIEQCYRRGQGLCELKVTLPRPDDASLTFSLQLSHPTRSPKLLLNLFRCAMEQQQMAAAPLSHSSLRRSASPSIGQGRHYVAQPNFDAAFIGLRLKATRLDALTEQQTSLDGQDEPADLEQWMETIDRLRIRFGPDSIVQAKPVESHLPEHAFAIVPAEEPQRHQGTKAQLPVHSQSASLSSPASDSEPSPWAITEATSGTSRCLKQGQALACTAAVGSAHRPLTLLPTPQEIRVTVSPSDDRDGRPIQFSDEDGFHRVAHWVGPERIASQWWEGHNKTRDYFDVEDDAGRRHWIFRVQETGHWYLHGVFS